MLLWCWQLLHVYTSKREAQFGLLKPVPGIYIFWSFSFIQHICQRCWHVPWLVESLDCVGRTASPFSVQSVSSPRSCRHSSKKQKQHLNHCMSYVSWCCHFISLSATLLTHQTKGFAANGKWTFIPWHSVQLGNIPCTLSGNCVLWIFIVIFVCFCPGHFSAGGPYVQCISIVCHHWYWLYYWQILLGMNSKHPRLCLIDLQHTECLLLIYLCICYCCWGGKTVTSGHDFLNDEFNVLCS